MEIAPNVLSATLADVPALAAFINHAYRGESSPQSWTNEAHLLKGARINEAQLRNMLRAPSAVLLKLTGPDKSLVGCVYLQQPGAWLYLSMLAVAPAAQAQGVGGQLLAAAEVYARQQNCPRIKMSVLSARPELLAWYERHGYQRTGVAEPFPATTDFGQPQQSLTLLELAKAV